MDVPQNLPKMNTNSKNSTKVSYNGGHIQKIVQRVPPTTRTPIQTHHQPNKANLGGKDRDRSKAFNTVEYVNRLRHMLNSTRWSPDQITWLYSPRPTRDFSSFFNGNYKEPVPEIEVPVKYNMQIPMTTIFLVITSVLFLVIFVLRIIVYACEDPSEESIMRREVTEERNLSNIAPTNPRRSRSEERSIPRQLRREWIPSNISPANPYEAPSEERITRRQMTEELILSNISPVNLSAQEQNNNIESFSLLLNPECSTLSDRYSDLPPTYFECAVRNDGAINKIFEANSEELPPPYSMCLETLKNTNGISEDHKRQSGQQPESSADTDVHLNNIVDTDRSNAVHNSSDAVTLSTNETTIDINDGNDVLQPE